MKGVWISPDAEEEFREAAFYYEDCSPGLGRRFLAAVGASLEQILLQPEIYRRVDGDFRKARVIKFPYGIIFRVRENQVQVFAVMHLRREPGYWKSRKRL